MVQVNFGSLEPGMKARIYGEWVTHGENEDDENEMLHWRVKTDQARADERSGVAD